MAMFWRGMWLGAVVALVALGGGTAAADPAAVNDVVRVKSLADGHEIADSRAMLHRKSDRVAVKVTTSELDPHETVDVLWVVFNDPAACVHGNPTTGSPCGPADLFVPGTRASLQFVASLTADGSGRLSYKAALDVGDTSRCIAGFPCGDGLTDPLHAEVHSALFTEAGGRQAAQFLPPDD